MAEGFHPPVEQHLEAVWELEEEGVAVSIQARVVGHVGHSALAVSEVLRRLRADVCLALDSRSAPLLRTPAPYGEE